MKNIVLIGFMGTGKTAIGSRLAEILKYNFIDTDKIIEDKKGMTISEIFNRYGEGYFREIENKVVKEVSNLKGSVIATGGGVVLNPENLNYLKRNGILICLKTSPDLILSRTDNDSTRPLLDSRDRLKGIVRLLKIREPYYARADITVDTSDMRIEDAVEAINSRLSIEFKIPHRPPLLKERKRDLQESIRVGLKERGYDIEIGDNTLKGLGGRIKGLGVGEKIAIITNPLIKRLYGKAVNESLRDSGYRVKTIVIPDGERYKSSKWVRYIYDRLISAQFERNSSLIALGGGVVGDMTGFAAATFLRGINYIQVPTSLIAQIDSSIGGKTGVNHPKGKNLIGAFYQPCLVYIDTSVLKTLDRCELIAGIGEIIKYGVIADEVLFRYLEENIEKILSLNRMALIDVIRSSCKIKARIVQEDEQETIGKRCMLNYGHTIGHALETIGGYKRYRHGEAIAIGMVYASLLSWRLGLCDKDCVERQKSLIERAGLPTSIPAHLRRYDIFIKTIRLDKKVRGGKINLVLPTRIGDVVLRSVEEKRIREVLKEGDNV